MTRPPQDLYVVAVLDYEIPALGLILDVCLPRMRGTRVSNVQDGEDVDVLRSSDYASPYNEITENDTINLKTILRLPPNDLDAGLSVRVWSRVKLRLRFFR